VCVCVCVPDNLGSLDARLTHTHTHTRTHAHTHTHTHTPDNLGSLDARLDSLSGDARSKLLAYLLKACQQLVKHVSS
jgi:hypothetical protein